MHKVRVARERERECPQSRMQAARVCCLSVLLLGLVMAQYEVNFESVDVDSILSNRRLMDAYTRCYLDKGPCAPPAREAKKYLAEVFRTNCGKCNKEQKKQIKSAFNKLIKQRPQDFLKIFAKYNPGSTHLGSFTRWLKTSD